MGRPFIFVYGVVSQLLTLGSLLYFALWVTRLWVAKTVDSGEPGGVAASVAVDLILLAVYCFAHSVLARTSVKKVMRRHVPLHLERATYCLLFALGLIALCLAWRPLPEVLWRVTAPSGVEVIYGLFVLFWVLHFGSIFWMGYSEFFGLRQTWLAARGETYRPPPAMSQRSYTASHLLLVVSLMAIPWATPTMSAGQLLLCVFTSLYVVVGAFLSHRDLGDVPQPVAA